MICSNCKNKTICKYFGLLESFPGILEVKECYALTGGGPSDVVKDIPVRTPRTQEEINATADKVKKLDAIDREKQSKKTKKLEKGKCYVCKKKSNFLVRCDDCNKLVCSECATEDISDHKTYCPTCYNKI